MTTPPIATGEAVSEHAAAFKPSMFSGSRLILCAAVLAIGGFFLFFRLGHYALWDDEAVVALSAKGILQTGDTTAVLSNNIVAYNNGILLHNLHDRSTPPLPAYMTAVAMALTGTEAWSLRLPFAFCGLATVLLVLRWLFRNGSDTTTVLLVSLALLGNISLFLFCRQCRYYAPSILLSTALGLAYLRQAALRARPTSRELHLFGFLAVCLFASNYLNWTAFILCLGADYVLWGSRRFKLRPRDWTMLVLPQAILCGAMFAVWNPFQTGNSESFWSGGIAGRMRFIWMFLRDANSCEFGAAIFLLVAPLLFWWRRNAWLLRVPLALIVYVVAMAALCPVQSREISEVRYLAPTIPLWIALEVVVIRECAGSRKWLAIALGVILFSMNLLQANWLRRDGFSAVPVRSTVVEYVHELIRPSNDPYAPVAQWINREVKPGQTVWVTPEHMLYPLMYHAPAPTYAWQLVGPAAGQFAGLAPIHFVGQVPPDYIVAFGQGRDVANVAINAISGKATYELAKEFDQFWQDTYRPELFLRQFRPVTRFDRETEAIYVFRRK